MKKQILIPIQITTDYFESGDSRQDDKIRLDQTSYYLSSIFWFLNLAPKAYDLLDTQTETKLFTFPEFRARVETMSEIGAALAERLTVYSLAIKDTPEKISHAEMISALINDESVPEKISDALSEAVTDIFNRLPEDSAAKGIDRTPEYIETVLRSYSEVKND